MKLSLAENINKLRKKHSMTQEQLAEALGVTFASVSKWERGVSTPDLSLIAEMADLFSVSMDTLVGFEVQNGNVVALEDRILSLQREKNYTEAIAEAEKALLRYPNNFRIVHCCGELYAIAGFEQNNPNYLHRCIELLEYSILLLSQNTVPEISDVTIQNMVAQCYILLGQKEKGIEILKKYNVGGIHNDLIALTYTEKGNEDLSPTDAETYMMRAFGNIITSTIRTMMSYANYYFKLKDYASSRDSLTWLISMLQSIKLDSNRVAHIDKLIAPCYAECATLSFLLDEQEKVEPYLRHAYDVAKAFDATPTYNTDNIKFCVGDTTKSRMYDDLGESALASVEKQIIQENELYHIWKKIIEENTLGGFQ